MEEEILAELATGSQLKGKALKAQRAQRAREHQEFFQAGLLRPTQPSVRAAGLAAANAAYTEQAEARPSGLEMVGAALAGNTDSVLYDALFRAKHEPVPGYKPLWAELPKNTNTDLLHRVASSQSPEETADYVSDFHDEQIRMDAVMSRGAGTGIALQFGAEFGAVTNFVAPFVVAKGLAKLGRGSDVLFQSGKTAEGYTSAITENLLSGTAIEAFKQTAQGEFKPVDLGISLVADGLIGAGTGWLSARNAANRVLNSAADEAATRELGLVTRAEQELGKGAATEDLVAKVAELRKSDANTIIADSVIDSNKIIDDVKEMVPSQQTLPSSGVVGDVNKVAEFEDANALTWRAEEFSAGGVHEWAIADRTNGTVKTLDDLRKLPAGVNYIGDAVPQAMRPAVDTAMKLARKFLGPEFRLTINSRQIPVDLGDGKQGFAHGSLAQVDDNAAMMLVSPDLNPEQMVRTVAHEIGHAVFNKYIGKLPVEQREALRSAFLSAMKRAEAAPDGNLGRSERFSITNVDQGFGEPSPPKLSSTYDKDWDEFSAEQLVKYVYDEPEKLGLADKTIKILREAIDQALAFFKLVKRDNTYGVTNEYKAFFDSILSEVDAATKRTIGVRPASEVFKKATVLNPDRGTAVIPAEQLLNIKNAGNIVDSLEAGSLKEILDSLPTLREVPVIIVKQGDTPPREVITAFNNGAAAVTGLGDRGVVIYLRSDITTGMSGDIPVHEVVHAATMAALMRNPDKAKELRSLAQKVAVTLREGKDIPPAVATFFKAVAGNDADELLAYGLTSPTFRKYFEGITASGHTVASLKMYSPVLVNKYRKGVEPGRFRGVLPTDLTLWDVVVDVFLKLLGKETNREKFVKALDEYTLSRANYEQEVANFNSFKMLPERLQEALKFLVDDAKANGLTESSSIGQPGIKAASNIDQKATPSQVVNEIVSDPDAIRFGLNLAPVNTPAERAQVQAMLALHKKAEAWEKANPFDDAWKARAKNLADNEVFNVASIGLTMLNSPSPLIRMLASELVEDASGVAGKRRNTAAISKYVLERQMMGNSINDIQNAYDVWKVGKPGANLKDELFTGTLWDNWNTEISKEIEARLVAGKQVNQDPNVTAAVDSIQASYQRIADAERKFNTLGSEGLPKTSLGYMPHYMNPQAVMNLTNAQRQVLHSTLVDQFVTIEGWDITFADQLASKYMQRVRDRASGDYGSAMGGHGLAEVVQEALVAMQLPEDTITKHMANFYKGAPGHTKSRINLDLNKVHSTPDGDFKLLDVFETDQIALLRKRAGSASGDVALTKHGIRGRPAVDLVRKALQYGEDGKRIEVNGREFGAFDQMIAEFRNEPFGTAPGKWLNRAMQANTLVRLGGIFYNQLAETLNGIAHIGVIRTFETIAALPRLRREIIALSKGEVVDNPIIGSIEVAGGAEFGTDAYKFVMPFDSPNHSFPSYGQDTLTATDRLLRGGGYLQGKLSGWRWLHSAQQRGMAEQVTHKMLRYIREGKDDVALQQFGVTPELRDYLRTNLNSFAKFDARGKLVEFDATKIADPDMRDSVVQTVHRGVSQIIQGTFIGERGKWAHDGVMQMMTQFRTFSITSMEKQWGRQRNSRGAYGAFGLLLGTMSLSIPIYMARTYAASIGRADQEAYLEERLAPNVIARATLNYAASSGLIGDFADLLTAPLPAELGIKPTGGRAGQESTFVGNYIAPAFSLFNDTWSYAQSPLELDDLAKIMPFRNVPFLVPLFNQARE